MKKINENQLKAIVAESIKKTLNERIGSLDYVDSDDPYTIIYQSTIKAAEELDRAISFMDKEADDDYLCQRVKKIFGELNNLVYFIEQRKKSGINESAKKVLRESELGDRVGALRKQSRQYRPDECGNELRLDKVWNRGMGRQNFIEVLPDEGVILYNTMHTNQRDLNRIQQAFPEFKLEPIDKPWHSTTNLRFHRK